MRRFLLVAALVAVVPVAVLASFAGCSDNTYIPVPIYEASTPDAPPVDFESGLADADAGPPPADGPTDAAPTEAASDAPSDAPPSDGQTDSPAADAAGD